MRPTILCSGARNGAAHESTVAPRPLRRDVRHLDAPMIMRHLLRFPTTLLALAALSYSVELHFPHSVEAQSKAGPQEQFGYPTYSSGGVDMRGVAI
jgi:hypothetical protein